MEDLDFETGINIGSNYYPESMHLDEEIFAPFEGVENFVIPENPKYAESHQLDTSFILKKLKARYPKLTGFKHVSTYPAGIDELRPFIDFAKDNPEKSFDVVLDPDIFFPMSTNSYPYYQSFTIIDDDFAIVYRRDFIRQMPMCFLFFNSFEEVKTKFFTKDFRKHCAGIYELSMQNNRYVINPMEVKYVEEPILEEEIKNKIQNDMDCFFKNGLFYKENNLPRKRGLIVHGPHGNGKTSLIKSVVTRYPETCRVFIDCRIFEQGLGEFLNSVFPKDIDKIVVFEDVESISEGGHRSYGKRSSFLNFIDGPKTMENTLFIATTNHPDLVDPALIDRPSRFDRIYKVDLPNAACREKFLLKYFPELKNSPEELKNFVDDTKDFSGAYFKELFIVVGIQNSTLPEAIQDLKKQIKVRRNGKFDNVRGMSLHHHDND